MIWLWLLLLIFCPFGRLRYGIDPGVGAQRPYDAVVHSECRCSGANRSRCARIDPVTKVPRAPASGPYAGAKPFGLPFRRLEKVTRCKSETASGSTRSNGYAPNPIPNPIPQTQKKARSSRIAPFSCAAIYQLPSAFDASQNKPADSATVAGKVNTHANRMVRTVPPCRPLLLATMVPATPEDRT